MASPRLSPASPATTCCSILAPSSPSSSRPWHGHGAHLDATYYCPHHLEITGPCECRKPGVKLFRDAQTALGIDLARSYWVGDRLSDVEPARTLGGRALLVATGHGAAHRAQARALGVPVVADLAAAVDLIVRGVSFPP